MTGQANASSVSVVVPMYRAVPLVAEAIESILVQTMPVTRIIAVEDGSSDGSAEFVESRFPEVHVVRKPHGGLADTLNHGLAEVRTDMEAGLRCAVMQEVLFQRQIHETTWE